MMNEKPDREWLNKMANAEDKIVGGLSAGDNMSEKLTPLSTRLYQYVVEKFGYDQQIDAMTDELEVLESSQAQAQADVEAMWALREHIWTACVLFSASKLTEGAGVVIDAFAALPEHLRGASR